MIMLFLFTLIALFTMTNGHEQNFAYEILDSPVFTGIPKDFIFSTATASYQVEGAWNESGKGENIWDRLTHTAPQMIKDGSNGDLACDSYHLFKQDVQHIKEIGFKMYRFSLSWSRLFPSGYTSSQNPDGVRYYNDLINELRSNGIEPMVTIYHWDLPQPLEDIGGWLNSTIADIFVDYARAVFTLFGDRVKWWATINEPISISDGYGSTKYAPALNQHGTGDYISGHNVLRAHGKTYRMYDKEFRPKQKGRLSLVLDGNFVTPKNASDPTHIAAAETANYFYIGLFAHPIYSKTGDYPPVAREIVDRNSKAEGRNVSRLPYFTKEEIEEIKGSFDFMALNHYTTTAAEPGITGPKPSKLRDSGTVISPIAGAKTSPRCKWIQVVPTGFRVYLNWITQTYGNHEIFITENGYCDEGGVLDQDRVAYLREYLINLFEAINKDHINVIGYTVWSIMDNFEWLDGYTSKFGLLEVDFNSTDRARMMKMSAYFIQALIKNSRNNTYYSYEITNNAMKISNCSIIWIVLGFHVFFNYLFL